MAEKKRGLGRGLSALMSDVDMTPRADTKPRAPDSFLPIEKVHPNPDQPRRQFDKEALEELASSIEARGIVQPLIVRPHPQTEGDYQIVAGERRWRAAQIAKLHAVPVVVREFDDLEVLEIAIIENIQRSDLNPIEEAAGYRQLLDRFGHTQDQLAESLGKSRSHIANAMRLLQLPTEVQEMVQDGRLSAGHARALITTDDPLGLARQVVAKGLSVRETEKLAKGGYEPKAPKATRSAESSGEKDADTKALEGDLSASVGMPVDIRHKPGTESGQLTISYRSLDELDTLCRILSITH
ncbi:ParB/RepB/Spo0J family partition protein [Pseudaestuariivita atlantica]|uniref:Chromosome partitioning protein ParB n=1 Tax=Pseudaestuariivita atlantica TaxID=1317121 RepID=A0A0L1JPK3_9RHOB|nr:ParB/RepB/Spo0J family partition protein [Pseudaestuariivita atlantica]KNG93695.1 chromosome partitioning protein ParB [Pseudaestuariivita atlantica]